jgi:predicted deacetylase
MSRVPAIVSVHDLMPSTLERVMRILGLLADAGVPPATLLVVPGKAWTAGQLSTLRSLANRGHRLAGHGWAHKATEGPRSLYHWGHGRLISRNEAEHLSRPPAQVSSLIERCYRWFTQVDLPAPSLYVPPAWAMGALGLQQLRSLPFRWYEILRGMVDGPSGRVRWLPLAGFEADTTFRKASLRVWNACNVLLAARTRMPLRISIHPGDLDLLLKADLEGMIRSPWHFVREEDVMAHSPGRLAEA